MHKDRTVMVMLHGSGSTGIELRQYLSHIPLGEEYQQRTFIEECARLQIDIITPTALEKPYSPAMRMPMSVWFDRPANFAVLGSADDCKDEDVVGINSSLERISSMLKQVHDTFQHVFIGGFSMGGCLGIHILRHLEKFQSACDGKLRGLFSIGSFVPLLSVAITGLPKRAVSPSIPTPQSTKVPLLMMHGEEDTLIKCAWGQATATALLLAGVDVRFQKYAKLEHEICEDQLRDLLNWMHDTELFGLADAALSIQETKENVKIAAAAGMMPIAKQSANTGKIRAADSDQQDPGYTRLLHQETQLANSNNTTKDTSVSIESGIYTLEQSARVPNQWCIHFSVPETAVPLLVTRPVLACGGMFDVYADEEFSINSIKVNDNTSSATRKKVCGVYCIVSSSDPHNLAREIGRRLAIRIDSKGNSVNACPMA